MKVGPKVAGECNFAPTFVRRSRFSRGLENSTGIFREVRFYRPRALLSNYRFLCEVFLYRFASLSLSLQLRIRRVYKEEIFNRILFRGQGIVRWNKEV